MSSRSLVYATFDRYPAPKGAATHIRAFISALAEDFDEVDLVTVKRATDPETEVRQVCCKSTLKGIRHTELHACGSSLIERILSFRTQLRAWWQHRKPHVAHVRSIFEGYPIAREKNRWCNKLVFEVNGLPSIELKYHYPRVADDRELLKKIVAQEQICLDAADMIITVSGVNAAHLLQRGVNADRLCVIPNGVDTEIFKYHPPNDPHEAHLSLLYSGTLASWQGIHVAIEALALYRKEGPASLTIAGSGRPRQIRKAIELAERLGIREHLRIIDAISQSQLADLHHASDVILVPLMPNDRNLIQGCCPLKLLEAMASGTPIIASDLPVVSGIARPDIDAQLVRPGSSKAIKDALVRLRDDRVFAMTMSSNARKRIEQHFTWAIAQNRLRDAYQKMLSNRI